MSLPLCKGIWKWGTKFLLLEINEIISSEVKKANEGLSSIEKIRKFIIAEEPFSTENGLLTPTMKVKRHKVFEIYGENLDDLYGSKTH